MTLDTTSACVGGCYVPRGASMPIPPAPRPVAAPVVVDRFAALTPRERETLEAYIEIGVGKMVAEHLGVSIKTVEAHIKAARLKSGSRNLFLMALAYVQQTKAAE